MKNVKRIAALLLALVMVFALCACSDSGSGKDTDEKVEKKTDAVQELLESFGIIELVRTGMIALERGKYTIDEDTKEKGEFNYGKNVL